jgi:hypothetical protein
LRTAYIGLSGARAARLAGTDASVSVIGSEIAAGKDRSGMVPTFYQPESRLYVPR